MAFNQSSAEYIAKVLSLLPIVKGFEMEERFGKVLIASRCESLYARDLAAE